MSTRVLVCGGRNYANTDRLYAELNKLNPSVVIHGAARGADTLANDWAHEHRVPVRRFPANWQTHGRSAGPRRNAEMLLKGGANLVLAFPGGPGTADMVRRSRAAGLTVIEVTE